VSDETPIADLRRMILSTADQYVGPGAISEPLGSMILHRAINEGRSGELLECLMGGGSVTVHERNGRLVLVSAEQIAELAEGLG